MKFRKIIPLIIVTVMILTLLCSCGGDEVKEDNLETVEMDFDGELFIFGAIRLNEYYMDAGQNDPGDNMLARYDEVAKKFNLVFEFYKATDDNSAADVNKKIAAGMDIPFVYDMIATELYMLYKQDLLRSLNDLKYIDMNSTRWGTPDFLMPTTYDGKVYGFWPFDWTSPIPQTGNIMLFNYELVVNKFMQPTPYELLEQKKWNWTTFRDMLPNVTDLSDSTNKIFGLGRHDNQNLVIAAIQSNSGERVINDNGIYKFGFTSDAAIEGIDYAKELYQTQYFDKSNVQKNFSDGKVSFWACHSWIGTADVKTLDYLPIYTLDHYGWIPFPYGPKGTYGSWNANSYNSQRFFAVPESNNDADSVGLVMNELFAPFPGTSNEAWKAYARTNMIYDDYSYDIFTNLIAYQKYDYAPILGKEVYEKIDSVLGTALTNKSSSATAVQSLENAVNTRLDVELNDLG